MKRMLVIFVFLLLCLVSLKFTSDIRQLHVDDVVREVTCTYMPSDTQCGNFYISKNLDSLTFGQSLVVNGDIDIDKFVQDNKLQIVVTEVIDGHEVYLMYSKILPCYRVVNNQLYNIQLSTIGEKTKIGYPAIFDSF